MAAPEQAQPMPQQTVDIAEMPMPIELIFNQASAGFEFPDPENKDKFWLTFTAPNGIRVKVFYDSNGWQKTLDALQAKKSGILIARS